jgi:hypothetical protein
MLVLHDLSEWLNGHGRLLRPRPYSSGKMISHKCKPSLMEGAKLHYIVLLVWVEI